MTKIKLMDVGRQYREHQDEYDEAILPVLHNGDYIGGEIVNKFEADFAQMLGAKYCVSCGNGTDALILALKALGIGPGDEVITVSFTFFATAESISAVGATPVFIDVDKDTYCMDPTQIESHITSKTKAILPVHIYGNSCDMDSILLVAKKHHLFVVEDCAQAALTTYKGKCVGTFGDIGCFSFFPTKILGCSGDGGAILTNNLSLAKACQAYKTHGSGVEGFETMKKLLEIKGLPVPQNLSAVGDKYHNYLIGMNSRLDAVQAALLDCKLKYVKDFVARRQANASLYMKLLKDSVYVLPKYQANVSHSFYVFAVLCDNSDFVKEKMKEEGVEIHTYYPIPLHLQGAYSYLNYRRGELPVTEYLCDHSFAVPVYPEISQDEIRFVSSLLLRYGQ